MFDVEALSTVHVNVKYLSITNGTVIVSSDNVGLLVCSSAKAKMVLLYSGDDKWK